MRSGLAVHKKIDKFISKDSDYSVLVAYLRSGEARPVGRGEKEAAGGADAHLSHIFWMLKDDNKYIKSGMLLIEWMIGLRQR